MTSLVICFLIIYGVVQIARFAKNNPDTTAAAAKWLKQMFGS